MIALLGASGFIGSAFTARMRIRGIEFFPLSRAVLDYYQPDALRDWLSENPCEFLINCAGYAGKPNVDACEQHKAECLLANAVLPGVIAEACRDAGIAWGHVSSGCIFQGDGPGGRGFREDDSPNFCFRSPACSFYSGSKALGEEVIGDLSNCYVWRVRMPFSNRNMPRNYLSKVLLYDRLLDVRNSLSDIDEFVDACLDSWLNRIPTGIYHVTNGGSLTTREIVAIVQEVLKPKKEFHFFRDESEFMSQAAKTPRSCCVLDNSRALQAGLRLSPVEHAIRRALETWIR